ncbi:AlkA N-terminal domain-containing protein [Pseudomonas sp. TWI628]|uniref:AlkA N-terminal domain-containing protein n=1 Tax=Pseudomonas sp. TWI628 TaxID=3136788 RepID=UPI0032094BF3
MHLSHLHAVHRSLTASGQHIVWLRYPTPYHWPSTQAFLAARCIPGIETFSNGTYCRSLSVAGKHAVLEARPASGNRLTPNWPNAPRPGAPGARMPHSICGRFWRTDRRAPRPPVAKCQHSIEQPRPPVVLPLRC